jgi:hypothetical protein
MIYDLLLFAYFTSIEVMAETDHAPDVSTVLVLHMDAKPELPGRNFGLVFLPPIQQPTINDNVKRHWHAKKTGLFQVFLGLNELRPLMKRTNSVLLVLQLSYTLRSIIDCILMFWLTEDNFDFRH